MNRKELAKAMRTAKNIPEVEEWDGAYIFLDGDEDNENAAETCWACALGFALIGYSDGDYLRAEKTFLWARRGRTIDECVTMAELLEIPIGLAFEIEDKHLHKSMTVNEIAEWLESSEEEVA